VSCYCCTSSYSWRSCFVKAFVVHVVVIVVKDNVVAALSNPHTVVSVGAPIADVSISVEALLR
jgi:hypothetical protein